MFITVKLLNGYNRPLTYKVPSNWLMHDLCGTIVRVPLRTKTELGLVVDFHDELSLPHLFAIREALSIELFPHDPFFKVFIARVSDYYAIDSLIMYRRLRYCIEQAEKEAMVFCDEKTTVAEQKVLTAEQRVVVDNLMPHLITPSYQPTVLHGVTGSGKTEIYKALIKESCREKKTTVFLVPDVSLAVQFTNLFRAQLEDHIPIFGFHSASSASERRLLWQHLLKGTPALIVGVHLPLLLPLPSLGLIIIDEEHDLGYQEKQHPRLHTRDLGLLRAQTHHIPVLLGSATPSLSTIHNIQKKGWKLFTLKERFSGGFPRINVVSLAPYKKRSSFWISAELEDALRRRLAKKEQAIIFLNRRGYSFFMQCADCGTVISCTNCSVSLTVHQDKLVCHYCGMTCIVSQRCFTCKGTSFLKKGIGTQQVVELLQKMFPIARISRADLDATVNKKKWQATVQAFSSGEIDILVGTQTIIKGYHFPQVTLVGVIWADSNLHLPLYHAAETTLQQLLQVAGRAGRVHKESDVIIQTMGQHKLFSYLTEAQYHDFCMYEMEHRKLLCYPPYIRLASLELRYKDEAIVDDESHKCASLLANFIETYKIEMVLLGPAPPLIHKVKNIFIRVIYLKSSHAHQLVQAYRVLDKASFKSALFFTQNPLS